MPIITKPPAAMVKKAITIRMPELVAATLHQYASFLGSSLDHVVVEALKLVFKKDAEFKEWQEQNQSPASPDANARPSVDVSSPASPPVFVEKERDSHRATGGESREG